MNRQLIMTALVTLGLTSLTAHAELKTAVFPGNEAVTTSADGKRVVKYPPFTLKPAWPAPIFLQKPTDKAPRIGTTRFDVHPILYMIEGPTELLECSERVIDKLVCRPSTLGKEKHPTRSRYWLVVRHNQWTTCGKANSKEKPIYGDYICESDQKPGIAFVVLTQE